MRQNEWFGRLVLAGFLTTGFVVVWGLAALWGMAIGEDVLETPARGANLRFLADGTVRVERYVGSYQDRQFEDLEGNPVSVPANDKPMSETNLPAALPRESDSSYLVWRRRLRVFDDGRSPAVYWYFVADCRPDGTGYFVGYDSQSKGRVGYLGLAGFRETEVPVEEQISFEGITTGLGGRVYCAQGTPTLPTRYPDRGLSGQAPPGSLSTWDVFVLGRDSKLYHADLHHRFLEVVLDAPGVRSAGLVAGPTEPGQGTPTRLAVRTGEEVMVLGERGQVISRYPVPAALRERAFAFGETTRGEAVMHCNTPLDRMVTQVDYTIYWVAPDGRSRQAEVTLPWSGSSPVLRVLAGVIIPSPLVLGGFVGINRSLELLQEGLAATYPEALNRAFGEFWPSLALALLTALGLAVLCYRRQVRYGAHGLERWAWPLFVLVLGVPGWLGYRFGRAWPVVEACPSCGVGAPRDRDSCARCEVEFPRPALRGTEVFA